MLRMCLIVAETAADPTTVNSVISVKDALLNVNTTTSILVNIIVIVGGILGFKYVKKLREKQMDSIFSYQTRLNVRLRYFHEVLVTYRVDIIEYFFPEADRRETSADRIGLVRSTVKHLAEYARDTMKFLRDENNQMPAKKGWSKQLNAFIKFLIDCEQLDQPGYFKWLKDENGIIKSQQYYKNVSENIDRLLQMIEDCQEEVEGEIFKEN